MLVERYAPASRAEWDRFVAASKNGTFLFLRDYMDYHADRFTDHSLIVRHNDGEILAVLPANERGDELASHGGLSYGGFVSDERMSASLMLDVFRLVRCYLVEHGFRSVLYKAIPYIYHQFPAGEDLYCLFRFEAQLVRRDLSTVAIPGAGLPAQGRRIRGRKKAIAAGVSVDVSERYADFWRVLEWNLETAHGLAPVHTLAEMELLASRFPNNIRLYCATQHGQVVAGCVVYETPAVAHAQYTASSEAGRQMNALDLLFLELVENHYQDKRFFSFGVSSEQDGRYLNEGLAAFKEGFGARTIVHDFYAMPVCK